MTKYIPRTIATKVEEAQRYFPVTVISGPRQSGKTSLSRHLRPDYKYVNLEDITMRAAATADPANFMDSLGKTAIIDEVQNVPELLSMIQVKVDEDPERRYILTGSSNFTLLQKVSQSLAGRAALFTLLPFALSEINPLIAGEAIDTTIMNGLYPGVIANGIPCTMFYRNYYNTYVERDLRDLLQVKNILAFDSFMRLLAARIGSEFNASALAREVGVSSVTISEWFSILSTSYIAFPLRPYFANVSKQYAKMPKIYFYDTGLPCFLLGIENEEQLLRHPLRGALFENLAVCELIKRDYNAGKDCRINFYREKSGTEVDVVLASSVNLELYEIKSGSVYRADFTRNMQEVASTMPQVSKTTMIYNGPSIPPAALNIHDI